MNKFDSVSAGAVTTCHQTDTIFSRYGKLSVADMLVYGYTPLLWIMALLLAVLLAGCGNGGSDPIFGGASASGVNKEITAYSLNGIAGTINESAKTIAVTVPFATNVTALVATYTHNGVSVKVGSTVQVSGTTPNNFTGPVLYTVTAQDASTAIYTVTVTIAPSTAKALTAFSFAGYAGATGVINEPAKTVAVTVPNGTNVTALVATFATTGASVKVGLVTQTSGTTANNFTSPVAYTVTAANATTAVYTVTVTIAPSTAKALTAFSFAGYTGATGVINEPAKTIAVTVPNGTNVLALVATFTTTGSSVKVGGVVQTSAVTAHNFTGPVVYVVTAGDASTATYTVTVTIAPSAAKALTGFSFAGYTGATGVINEPAKTIAVTVPNGTDVTTLVATFTTTGTIVRVGAAVQTSTATANDFTSPVAYVVTAANATTATYTVTVTVAAATSKAMTSFSFAGYTGATGVINEPAKTIAVTVPNGTNVTALVATFASTGVSVKVGLAVQTSTATANNFTSPVAYIVTAGDASTATYTVTVTIAPSTAKAMTSFSFAGYTGATGVINEPAKTIAVTVPNGTDVTTLVATFTTTGSTVKVGVAVQTSAATANNFTSPVAYIVTAGDASTATYTVTVTVAASTAKAMTSFSFAGYTGATGVINEPAKTIAVTVPNGTNVTALVATFASTGVSVKVGLAVQTSTATANNFTSPVAYIVTAGDASTATYTVTVTIAPATAKAFTSYSFAGYTGATGVINEPAKTIAVTVPSGTNVTALVATYATTGASVKVGLAVQTSAATANNFSVPVIYTVTAADASTVNYTVTVTVAASSAKAITSYSFAGYTGATGVITEPAHTIAVTVPNGTDVTTLVATFATTGANVKVGAAVQTSTATANNFSSPVAYTVTAGDATTATYTVTVTIAPSAAKAITAFSFAGYTGATGTINELAKTIAVTVPNGTTLTALVATYTTTGSNVHVGAAVQTSTVTPNDFTSPVVYTVTAADASTANYTVTVSLPLGPAPVFLGTAGNFVILAKTGISTIPSSTITGDIGVSPAAATFITGFSLTADSTNVFSTSPQVTGQVFAADYAVPTPSNMTTAIGDMQTAFTDAAGRTTPDFVNLGAGDVSGMTLAPGLYTWGTGLAIGSSGVTISGGPNDVWIFQIAGNLTVANAAIVTLAGGALPKNIFWQVSGQTTLGTTADFKGIVLCQTLISLNTGAVVNGRLLAQTAVTLDQNPVTKPAP